MIGFDTSSDFSSNVLRIEKNSWKVYYLGEEVDFEGDPLEWLLKLEGEFSAALVGSEIIGARGQTGVYPLFLSPSGFSTFPSKNSRTVRAGEVLKLSGEVLRERRKFSYPPKRISDENEAIRILSEALERIQARGAIAFSGGLDSSLLQALCDGELFSICAEGSHDEKWLPRAAGILGRSLNLRVVSEEDVGRAMNRLLELGFRNPLDISIGVPLLLLSEFVRESGERVLIMGQGADELFGGYSRYLSSENLDEELLRDLNELDVGLARDSSIVLLEDLHPRYPFLQPHVIETALKISPELKIRNGVRKYILRRVAEKFIPGELAWKEKKAIQYSTGILKLMRKIIKRKGFKGLKDYLEVESK
ncbi:MAG: hypothetical protein PWR13_812 [Archaeoglobi archaeon]|nr:asparagine synthetase B [Candidatus Mnemosynella bozhongmuii]MDI3502464.1 hypothetical protein [Archaeoglobi archaeon]MDK2781784.1 hypothetical protein [Archaeoglobi archaeon]